MQLYIHGRNKIKSIVCILGTGSNCTYDGENIDQRVTS